MEPVGAADAASHGDGAEDTDGGPTMAASRAGEDGEATLATDGEEGAPPRVDDMVHENPSDGGDAAAEAPPTQPLKIDAGGNDAVQAWPAPAATTLYRSGWTSTPRLSAAPAFVPSTDHEETKIQKEARETKEAAERQREKEREEEIRREAEEKAVGVERERLAQEAEEKLMEQQRLAEEKEEELRRLDAEKEAKEKELQVLEQKRIENEKALEEQGKAVEMAPAAAAAAAAPVGDEGLKKAEEGTVDDQPSVLDSAEQKAVEEVTEQKVGWWQNKKYRWAGLAFLLVVVGSAVGLGIGLSNNDNGGESAAAPADAGEESSRDAVASIPLVVDRSCKYEKAQTVFVSAIDDGVSSGMSGGRSDFDGENAVVVAHNQDGVGAVWALSKDGETWKPTPLQSDEPDRFGWDVAISGETIVVGSPGYRGGRGAAFVFTKNWFGVWYMQQVLLPEEAEPDAEIGVSVDIAESGDLIAVGGTRGSVYVFAKVSEDKWEETQKLTPNEWKAQFSGGGIGQTVAISDDLLAIKSPSDLLEGNMGVVYMYARGSDGIYAELDRLSAPEGPESAPHHSPQVALLDDFVLVGSPGNDRVYVFQQTSMGRYQKTTDLVASDATADGSRAFGFRLDGQGTSVLVSDPIDDSSYLFTYEDGVWKEKAKYDGYNAALSGKSILAHTQNDFETNGSGFWGPVHFYDLECEPVRAR